MKGLEPIRARDLRDFLIAQGCTFHHQVGSHLTGTGPNGQTIRIPDPGSDHPVTTLVVRELGRQFGMNLHDARVWLGYGKEGKSKLTGTRAARIVRTATPRAKVPEVADLAARIRSTSDRIYRSGDLRKRGSTTVARSELHAIAIKLDQWCRNNEGAA